MKKLCFLIFVAISITIYAQPAKTDPYFKETWDTVSYRGPSSIVRHILQDKKGNIWLATWQGIMMYNGKLFTNYTKKDDLIHFHVFSIMEDRSGNLWFGTIRGGLYKYNPSAELKGGKAWTLYTTEDGMANDIAGYMMEDRTGNIWIATDEGVSRFDTSSTHRMSAKAAVTTWSGLSLTSKKGFTTYTTENGLAGNRVNCIMQDKTGKIWITTRTGVSWYDPSAQLKPGQKLFTDFNIKLGVPFKNTWRIIEDKKGKIWIGGEDGLYCYDPSQEGEKAMTKIAPNFVGCVFEDKAGNIWFNGGIEKGMALFKYDSKTITKIIEKNKEGDSQVFEITQDKDDNIWFGTMNGACRYDGKTFEEFRSYIQK